MKALSPGVNDTTTATTCIDWLTAINVRLANRRLARPLVFEDGRLRVIANGPGFKKFVRESFDDIRANAAGNATVILRLHRLLWAIYKATDCPARKPVLSEQLSLLEDLMKQTIDSDYNVARMRRSHQ